MRQVLDAEPFSRPVKVLKLSVLIWLHVGARGPRAQSLTFDPGSCRFCPALWILQLHS